MQIFPIKKFRSHRLIPRVSQTEIAHMDGARIPPVTSCKIWWNELEGITNWVFLKQDLKNHLKKFTAEKGCDGDSKVVFKRRKTCWSLIFLTVHYGWWGLFRIFFFWCDKDSRIVHVFDTTYKSNAYNKSGVVLLGINHNWKIVPFGCVLVEDKKNLHLFRFWNN